MPESRPAPQSTRPDVFTAPGSYQPLVDHWGPFPELAAARLPEPALVLIDERVAKLHPRVMKSLKPRAAAVVSLRAGENAKTMGTLDRVVRAANALPRSGAVVCIGGGTIGDLGTVAAHLIKRGVRLLHVPTTLLAAVDSSVGGKGALHSGGQRPVKNAIGVFHYPTECWLCPELFATLKPKQLREGAVEAFKMVITLSEERWLQYRNEAPEQEQLIRDARALKAKVCAEDPYEHEGLRRVLNFGHTFGHVIESVTRFSVSHGDAVGLGMLCALDVGLELGVTVEQVAEEAEEVLLGNAGVLGRGALAEALADARLAEVEGLLAADKKTDRPGELRMVLLREPGRSEVRPVPREVWRRLWPAWRKGARP
jgi:3-dehydroquinate synthase